MSLFDHGEPEEFLFFIWNFNMTLAATRTQEKNAKILYLLMLVCGEVLRQFDFLSSDVENMDKYLSVNYIIKGLK